MNLKLSGDGYTIGGLSASDFVVYPDWSSVRDSILAQQEMTLANVVKTTVFLADINDFAEMNKVYGEYFAQPYPARSAVQVGKLPKDAPLEIECIAVK